MQFLTKTVIFSGIFYNLTFTVNVLESLLFTVIKKSQ